MSRKTVLDTLVQFHAIALDFIKCKGKWGQLIADEDDGGYSEALKDHAVDWSLNRFPDIMQFLKKPQHSGPLVPGLSKRLQWAASSKERYEKLINKFRELNDVLIDLVDSEARLAIRESTRETNTTILHLHSKIDELVMLTKAWLPDTPIMSPTSSPTRSHFSDVQQRHDLSGLAYFKAVSTLVDSCYPVVEGRQLEAIKLARSDIQLFSALDDTSDRCEADYQPMGKLRRRVWVGWREYDPIFEGQPGINPSRIDKVVALLSNPQKPDLVTCT